LISNFSQSAVFPVPNTIFFIKLFEAGPTPSTLAMIIEPPGDPVFVERLVSLGVKSI